MSTTEMSDDVNSRIRADEWSDKILTAMDLKRGYDPIFVLPNGEIVKCSDYRDQDYEELMMEINSKLVRTVVFDGSRYRMTTQRRKQVPATGGKEKLTRKEKKRIRRDNTAKRVFELEEKKRTEIEDMGGFFLAGEGLSRIDLKIG